MENVFDCCGIDPTRSALPITPVHDSTGTLQALHNGVFREPTTVEVVCSHK